MPCLLNDNLSLWTTRSIDRAAEPLEQGNAKTALVRLARGQGDGVDLVLKDIVLGVHGGMTGPGLERHKRSVVGGDHTPMYLKPSKSILTPWPDLRPRQRERGAGVSDEHDGIVIETAVRDGQHVRVVGSLIAALKRHKTVGCDDGSLVRPSLGKRQLVTSNASSSTGRHVNAGWPPTENGGPHRRYW